MVWFYVFVPFVCLAINVSVQICIYRLCKSLGLLNSIVYGFIAGFLFVLIFGWYFSLHVQQPLWESFGSITANTISYIALGYCYFHFINLGETARRIRILIEIQNSADGLEMHEILRKYNAKQIIEFRLGRLLRNGQIVFKDGRYFAGKPLVLIMAKILIILKIILLGKPSEFN